MINFLSNQESFFPVGPARSEHALLSIARRRVGTGVHSGQEDMTEALAAPRPVEGRHGLPETVDRPTIVALEQVGHAKVLVR